MGEREREPWLRKKSHTERKTDSETERKTDSKTQRKTDSETERKTSCLLHSWPCFTPPFQPSSATNPPPNYSMAKECMGQNK